MRGVHRQVQQAPAGCSVQCQGTPGVGSSQLQHQRFDSQAALVETDVGTEGHRNGARGVRIEAKPIRRCFDAAGKPRRLVGPGRAPRSLNTVAEGNEWPLSAAVDAFGYRVETSGAAAWAMISALLLWKYTV